MRINADFSRCAMVLPEEYQWVSSPQQGVTRVMLDRVGEEKARATSVVTYQAGSFFSEHTHPNGEEIFVHSGVFCDESGCYSQGWYLRNPDGSKHKPYSEDGATIFVKLRQMKKDDQESVRINTNDPDCWQSVDGRDVCTLCIRDDEQVSLQRLHPGKALFSDSVTSAEIFVLDGALIFQGKRYEKKSWLRLPEGEYADLIAAEEGVTLYLKVGHLDNMNHEADL